MSVSKRRKIEDKIMVLDTETTGFPQKKEFADYFDYKMIEKYDSSRIVQIAYILMDSDMKEIKRVCHIIKPHNHTIPSDMIHGITHQMAIDNGKTFDEVVKEFAQDLQGVVKIIGHNVAFDKNVFMSELYRRKKLKTLQTFSNLDFYCTAENAKPICKIKIGEYLKTPNLKEAYDILVRKPINLRQHDALNDCQLCMEIYNSIVRIENEKISR
jgi:DNA polymerase III epsilon subunit-like protein